MAHLAYQMTHLLAPVHRWLNALLQLFIEVESHSTTLSAQLLQRRLISLDAGM